MIRIGSKNAKPYALCFETLSNELRLKILGLLAERPMSVQELAEKLKVERSRVSHSLEMLRDCIYVEYRKSGKERVYSLSSSLKGGLRAKTAKPMHIFDIVDLHVEENCAKCRKLKQRKKAGKKKQA